MPPWFVWIATAPSKEVSLTPDDFFAFAKKNEAEMVDLKFVDMLGSWQHCSFPIEHLDKNTFTEGLGFDGSSIRGWRAINASDMLVIPDPTTAWIDVFNAEPTLRRSANGRGRNGAARLRNLWRTAPTTRPRATLRIPSCISCGPTTRGGSTVAMRKRVWTGRVRSF